tara:strand:- start:54 stop:404 length:351 start_codon:yes stop_codon:yes gene_type:complete
MHPNLVARGTWGKGSVTEGEALSHCVFEHTFETQHQGYIEPHATTVMIDADGRVQVWVNSKGPWQVRTQLEAGIGAEESAVRVNPTVIGVTLEAKAASWIPMWRITLRASQVVPCG